MRRIGLHALAALLMLWISLACSPSASTERVVALASEPVAAAPSNEVALGYGRVVDEQRAPVADATVELKHGDRLLARAVSGADGKFEMRGVAVDTDWSSPPLLSARSSEGQAVHRSALTPRFERGIGPWSVDGPRDEDWKDIVLRRAHALEVRMVGAPASVDVQVHLLQTGELWGWWGWIPVASTQGSAAGLTVLDGLPPGRIQVTAIDSAHGACAYTTLPSTDVVELKFKPLRTCEVRLVNKETGLPVSGAEVRLELVASASGASPEAQYGDLEVDGIVDLAAYDAANAAVGRAADQRVVRTDQAGLARLTGLLPGEYYLAQVDAEGYRRRGFAETTGQFRVFPSESAKTIYLRPRHRTTMRWLIPNELGPAPADGTVIEVREIQGSYAESVFGPTLNGRMENGLLVVHDVLDQDLMSFVAVAPDGRRAHLSYVAAEVGWASPHLRASSFAPPLSAGGELIDIQSHPALGAASRSASRSVTVELRDVRGQPASGVRVSLNGSRVPVDDVVTDALGLARFDKLWPDRVSVSASGSHWDFSRYSVTIGEANLADGDASFRATWRQPFRAIATVTLDGRVGLPSAFDCTPEPIWADKDGGRFDFVLPLPDEGQTVPVHLMAYGFESAYTALTPNADGSTVHFELDLKSIDYHVVVRTEGFEGFKLKAERVAGAIEDHAFVNRIPDDAHDERRRRAELATYTASADGADVHIPLADGRWRIVDWWSGATTDEFELRHHSPTAEVPLLPGPFAPLRVHITPPETDYQPKSFRVGAYALGEAPDTLTWLTLTRTRHAARAYELGRGVWTLWIDPGDGWAPIRIERVDIGELGATIGPLELTRGSTLRVRVPADATGSRPHLYVSAALNGAPPFSRVLQSQGEAEVLLSGLCAGVYTVRIFDALSTDVGPARRLEFDGTNEVTIDWAP
jgi:hypothetical protein